MWGGESCDDGSLDTFGANSSCTGVHPGFYCEENTAGFPANRTFTICGDGLVAGFETCDVDILSDPSTFKIETYCLLQPDCVSWSSGWTCLGGSPTTESDCVPICGDGRWFEDEECDDGPSMVDGDGCSISCHIEDKFDCWSEIGGTSSCWKKCGNGYWTDSEECDDGNDMNGDGCSSEFHDCTVEDYFECYGGTNETADVCES